MGMAIGQGKGLAVAAAVLGALAGHAVPAAAQSVEQFYNVYSRPKALLDRYRQAVK